MKPESDKPQERIPALRAEQFAPEAHVVRYDYVRDLLRSTDELRQRLEKAFGEITRLSAPSSGLANRADRQHVLDMVRGVRAKIQRSPGMSHSPFSDDGWRIIEGALTDTGVSATRENVIEECAKVLENAPAGPALTKHNSQMAAVLRGLMRDEYVEKGS